MILRFVRLGWLLGAVVAERGVGRRLCGVKPCLQPRA